MRPAEKNYMMGDDFKTNTPPTLKLHLEGSDKFAKVTLVKDDVELKVWEPGTQTVNLEWTDPAPEKGQGELLLLPRRAGQ